MSVVRLNPPSSVLSSSPSSYTIDQTVDEIISYLKKAGSESYLGEQEESVTQLSHSLQAAAQASLYDSDEELIIAALLHDIGHMILAKPDVWDEAATKQSEQHEWVGYYYLLNHGFSQKIAELVLGHVEAKRYLTYTDPLYYDKLSDASKMTLIGQGGPFNANEASAFRQSPLYSLKIRMREWDEAAKVTDWKGTGNELQLYKEMILKHLNQQKLIQQQTQQQQS